MRSLDVNRWTRIEEIFAGALERQGAARAAFLDAECGDDPVLRAEVASLVAAHETEGAVPRLAEPESPGPDWRIGPFRLIEAIGAGGMGTVFLAEREGPDFVQRVALKLIRAGRSDPLLAERLRSERRILARLEHPNIARLIDGGLAPEGQPYFAMEYVQGMPLPEYCDARRLTVRERLRLFLRVCEAVQYAHTQNVVHRDLKPSNILVTEDGHPKLLDFGIAKLVDPADETSTTRAGSWATPAYASPEQVRGEPAGTPSDVYSLGVLLYELMAGHRPYHLDGRTPAEAQRIICDDPPTRPSGRLGGGEETERIAAARSLSTERLRRDLEGDLDIIVLKAMAKDPARRYPSPGALAGDLRRHLDGRPVLARPDSPAYRASRLVRRYRSVLVAASLAGLALLGGATVALWQARRATAEAHAASVARDQAQDEARKAQLVAGLMTELFRLNDPSLALGDTITARQVLDEGAARIDRELAEQPDVQASLLSEVSRVYANLGLLERADALARRSLELRTSLYGPESAQAAESLGLLGTVRAARGMRDDAIDALRRALAIRDGAVPAPDSVNARLRAELGWQLRDAGDYDEARRLFTQSLEETRTIFGAASPNNGSAMMGVAAALHDDGQFDEAETLFRSALEADDSAGARPNPMAATALFRIGQLRRLREQAVEAEGLLRAAWQMRTVLYEPSHPDVLEAEKEWGRALADAGRLDEAERVLVPGLERAARDLGPEHPLTSGFRGVLAGVDLTAGRYAKAAARFDTLLAGERAEHGAHPVVAFALVRLGDALLAAGRAGEAEARYVEAMALSEQVSGSSSVYRMLAINGLANVARDGGRVREAERLYAEAGELADTLLRRDHRYARRLRRDRAVLQMRTGHAAAAVAVLDSVAADERRILPPRHPDHGWTLVRLAEARLAAGHAREARTAIDDALRQFTLLPRDHEHVRVARALLRDARLLTEPPSN